MIEATALQEHYDRNADATGHDPRCRRRVVPTLVSDARALDPGQCGRCRELTEPDDGDDEFVIGLPVGEDD